MFGIRGKSKIKKSKRKLVTAALLVLIFAVATISGCGDAERGSKENRREKNTITEAAGSDTGSMDPAESIALTYLTYSVTALDELLTFDENGEIEYRAAYISLITSVPFPGWIERTRNHSGISY